MNVKTFLAAFLAGGLLLEAQVPPPTNSSASAVPAFPVPDEAARLRALEARRRAAELATNASAAALYTNSTSSSVVPLPGTIRPTSPTTGPTAASPSPVAAPAAPVVVPAGVAGAAPGNPPAPGAVAPAAGGLAGGAAGAQPVAANGEVAPGAEAAEFSWSFGEGVDANVMIDEYAKLVNRTPIRPATLPAPKMTLVTQTPLTREEAIQAFEAVFALNGIATIPWGTKFVKVLTTQQAPAGAAQFSELSSTGVPESSEYIVQIVHLQYAHPTEMISVLQPYGNLNNMQAIDSSGILVIRDTASNIKRMMEMVEKVDIPSVRGAVEPVVIPIKYALADDIAQVLSSLTSGGGGGTTVGRTGGAASGAGARQGIGRRGGISSSTSGGGYGPGGLQSGSPSALTGARLGGGVQPPAAGASFADRLNRIVANASGDFQILGEVKIISDPRTNSLLVFASEEDMAMIKKIVDKLDVVLAQVLIEAIVLEVSLNDTKDVGISAVQRPKSFTDKITGAGAMLNGNGQFLNNLTNFPGTAPKGFSYFGNIGDTWNVALQAIATDGSVNVLSRPRIQTSHAKQAILQVGDTVPYVTSSYVGAYGGTGSSSSYQQTFIGIEIDVTPLINPDGLVIMDIQQVNIEQLGTPTQIDGNNVPTTSKRYATANVAVRDGETIILGGFISNTRSKSKSGVPILKDIPFLGNLFSSKNDSNKRVELIVLMRPTVLKTPEIATKVALDESAKLPGVRAAVKDYEQDYERKMLQTGELPKLFQGADTNATQQLWPHAIPATTEPGPAH